MGQQTEQATTAQILADMRRQHTELDVQSIAGEREFLANGVARNVRTLRLMAFRTIRHAQRNIARRADDLIAALTTEAH